MLNRRVLAGALLIHAGVAQAGLVDLFNGVKVGAKLPEHDATVLQASPVAEPKLVLVDFWATWCAPCVAAWPRLSELQERFLAQGLSVLSLSDETIEVVTPFLRKHPTRCGVSAGGSKPLKQSLGIKALPYSLLARPDGRVVWRGQPDELNDAVLAQHLRA